MVLTGSTTDIQTVKLSGQMSEFSFREFQFVFNVSLFAVDQKDVRTHFKKMLGLRVKSISAVSFHSKTVMVYTTGAGNLLAGRMTGSRTLTTRKISAIPNLHLTLF